MTVTHTYIQMTFFLILSLGSIGTARVGIIHKLYLWTIKTGFKITMGMKSNDNDNESLNNSIEIN